MTARKTKPSGLLKAVEAVAWLGAIGSALLMMTGVLIQTGAIETGPLLVAGDRAVYEREQIAAELGDLATLVKRRRTEQPEALDAAFMDLEKALAVTRAEIKALEDAGDDDVTTVIGVFNVEALTPAKGHLMAADAFLSGVFLTGFAIFARRVRKGEVFDERHARTLSLLGWAVIALPVFTTASHFLFKLIPTAGDERAALTIQFNDNIFWGLIILALAAVFREGARLKREEEMTI